MRPFRYESISIHALSSTDLREEALTEIGNDTYPEAYRVWIEGSAQPAEAVHYTALNLVAFAWGAPADVYDAETIEDGIRQALEEPVDWNEIERQEMANAPEARP